MWDLLETDGVQAVYSDNADADEFLTKVSDPKLYKKHFYKSIGAEGISFVCRPEFGDIVEALNAGLRKVKKTANYEKMCNRYPSISCDTVEAQWANVKTAEKPWIADHPATRADIVIGTEADYPPFNYIEDDVLKGFDIELTKAVCKAAGKVCAIVTVPWQSVWPGSYEHLGWVTNVKEYPGIGQNNAWFHCTSGTNNFQLRQRSAAFTDPYTDKAQQYAGFVTKKTRVIASDAANQTVVMQPGQGWTQWTSPFC